MSEGGPSRNSAQLRELLQSGLQAHRAGDLAAAERFYKTLNKAAPRDFNALHLLGVLNAQRRQFADAERFLARAVAISPNPEALNSYGSVLTELGRAPEAIQRLQQAIRAKPDYPEAHFNLGNALRRAERAVQAISCYRHVLSLRPTYVEALQNLSDVLREAGRQHEAIDALRQAIALRPDSAILHNNLGIALRDVGALDEACAAFDRAIALDGRFVHPYWHRVRAGRIAAGDPIIIAMENLKAAGAGQGPEDRAMLHFALGKAHDDTGETDRAFASLVEANRIARDLVRFDEAADEQAFRQVEEKFTPDFVGARAGRGNPSELPIFVVGFPRSGTTLIEQILAAHPTVFGAGEVSILPDIVAHDEALLRSAATPESDAVDLPRLGTLYLDKLANLAPDATRITDKNPDNGAVLGFVHLMLPKARLIHVTRDPLDTCLSCFTLRFVGNNSPFSYDLGELGRRFRRYEKIMRHWQQVLPAGSILQVRYEDLVADFEPQIRRMLDFCGLSWDARCLAFHQATRAVRTASATQVRQSLYSSSIGRWRRYERHLGPLIEALGPDTPVGTRQP